MCIICTSNTESNFEGNNDAVKFQSKKEEQIGTTNNHTPDCTDNSGDEGENNDLNHAKTEDDSSDVWSDEPKARTRRRQRQRRGK